MNRKKFEMVKDYLDFYEERKTKLEREIMELREADKSTKYKENQLFEVELIIDGLNAEKEIENLREENRNLRKRLLSEGINIDDKRI